MNNKHDYLSPSVDQWHERPAIYHGLDSVICQGFNAMTVNSGENQVA